MCVDPTTGTIAVAAMALGISEHVPMSNSTPRPESVRYNGWLAALRFCFFAPPLLLVLPDPLSTPAIAGSALRAARSILRTPKNAGSTCILNNWSHDSAPPHLGVERMVCSTGPLASQRRRMPSIWS